MEIPEDFRQLCQFFYPGIFDEYSTNDECIAAVVMPWSKEWKQAMTKFLDQLLGGRYSDAEIERVWLSTNPSYNFSEGGHRIFLSEVRDMVRRTLSMDLDEFRRGMTNYRQAIHREAQAVKDLYHAVDHLRCLYKRFDAEERAMADQVLAEWALSEDDKTRFDARVLIDDFKIRSALPTLEKLVNRLAASTTVRASNELELVNRVIANLSPRGCLRTGG
jgi:hypothetical protein